MLRDHLRDIDLALAAMADLKPMTEYGVPGTYDTVQARRQKNLLQAETALLSLRRDLIATSTAGGVGLDGGTKNG